MYKNTRIIKNNRLILNNILNRRVLLNSEINQLKYFKLFFRNDEF